MVSKSKSIFKNISLWDIFVIVIIALLICSFLRSSKLIEGVESGDDSETTTEETTTEESEGVEGITSPRSSAEAVDISGLSVCIGKSPKHDSLCSKATSDECKIDAYCEHVQCDTLIPKSPYLEGYTHKKIRACINNLSSDSSIPGISDLQSLLNDNERKLHQIDPVIDNDTDTLTELGDVNTKYNILNYVYNESDIDKHISNSTNVKNELPFSNGIINAIKNKQQICSTGYNEITGKGATDFKNMNKYGNLVGYNKSVGLYCINSLFNNTNEIDYKRPKVNNSPYCKGDNDICLSSNVDYTSTPTDISFFKNAMDSTTIQLGLVNSINNPCYSDERQNSNSCSSYYYTTLLNDSINTIVDKFPSWGIGSKP